MKKSPRYSLFAVISCILVSIIIRLGYYTNDASNGYNATTWDAFGYYAYLPATFIYKDTRKLEWVPKVDSVYHVTGGYLYQADTLKNGRMAFKYLGGVAVMQSPFFGIGHLIAKVSDAPEDGFSWPYQYAIIWGALFWFAIGLYYLRKVLLCYFSDKITALTILLTVLATNLLQYVSVDGAMSHVYIFPLYSLLLYHTHCWHVHPKKRYLFSIGFIIGLAAISRPTELVMLFIPLLWNWQNAEAPSKWHYLWDRKALIILLIGSVLLGMLPQFIYWKYTTGSWVHNVGSKWYFLNPWWRVLFGFEKGWFIYTPITLLFVIGLFFTRGRSFHKAVLTFGLINIWIIISWSDWRYGASYSVRALSQSYPVYAFAMAGFLAYAIRGKRKWFVAILGTYFIALNLFQIWQYNRTILHFDHMNLAYYRAIYWDANPTAQDFSLLDSAITKPNHWQSSELLSYTKRDTLFQPWKNLLLSKNVKNESLVHFKADLYTKHDVFGYQWYVEEFRHDSLIHTYQLRLGYPGYREKEEKNYDAFFRIQPQTDSIAVSLFQFNPMPVKKLNLQIDFMNKND